jgi:hypothetical protein
MTYSIPNIPLSYSCYEEVTRGFGGEIGVNYLEFWNSDSDI